MNIVRNGFILMFILFSGSILAADINIKVRVVGVLDGDTIEVKTLPDRIWALVN